MASEVLHKASERRRKLALQSEYFSIHLYVYTINELQSQGVQEINNAPFVQPLTFKEGNGTHGQGCTNPGLNFVRSRQVFAASFQFFPSTLKCVSSHVLGRMRQIKRFEIHASLQNCGSSELVSCHSSVI
jgi:hypothetical protein